MNDITTIQMRPADDCMTLGGFEFGATALVVHGAPSFDEWAQAGAFIRAARERCHWWFGDWLAYGEGTYGERASQAMELTDWASGTLEVYASVARRVPQKNRFKEIPFGHYANGLANLPPAEQRVWADRVIAEDWTQAELRRQLRSRRDQAAPPAFERVGLDLKTDFQCPACGYEWDGNPKPARPEFSLPEASTALREYIIAIVKAWPPDTRHASVEVLRLLANEIDAETRVDDHLPDCLLDLTTPDPSDPIGGRDAEALS